MNPFFLGTNWKMHKTFEEARQYASGLKNLVQRFPQFAYFIIPPYTHLKDMKEQLDGTGVRIGAQNMHWECEGAYTGEISPQWLSDLGVSIAELGHSERRQYYNENDEDLNKKVKAALRYRITPLLCVGEAAKDKAYAVTPEVIRRQIKIALFGLTKEQASSIFVAYEPVWAIGESGVPAEPDYVEWVHGIIREQLTQRFESAGEHIPILYGGSVNLENCLNLARRRNVDGLFIGRSAWNLESFEKMITRLSNGGCSDSLSVV